MEFNTKKFKVIQVGHNEDLKESYNYDNASKDGPFNPTDEVIKKVNQKAG